MSDEMTTEKAIEIAEKSKNETATRAVGSSIEEIAKYIGSMAIKKIREDYINPFEQKMADEIKEIKDQTKQNEALFQTNVMEAVRRSRRALIEERIAEWNVENVIKQLTEIPESISANMTAEKAQRREAGELKSSFNVEIGQLVVIASQGGMAGGNAEDREAVIALIEDRVKNTGTHGEVVSLTLQSTSKKDSGAVIGCTGLNVSKAAATWNELVVAESMLEELTISGKKLEMQFKSLRSIVSLINSMSS